MVEIQMVQDPIETNGSSPDNAPLEGRLTVNIATDDNVLAGNLDDSLQLKYTLRESTTSGVIDDPIDKISDIYLLDILSLNVPDYARVIERVKYLKAIKLESKVVILATERQQSYQGFDQFRQAQEQGLVGILTRPNPSQMTESEYDSAIEASSMEVPNFLDEFYGINGNMENVEIIKVGGSIFDLYQERPDALRKLLETIVEIHQDHDLILTVGGGPLKAVSDDYKESLGISDSRFEQSSRTQITEQAQMVYDLLDQICADCVAYISPESMEIILGGSFITREFLKNKIPVMALLPENSEALLGVSMPSNYGSDAHTVAIADYLEIKKIIFAKDTDGIFERDPNLTSSWVRKLGLGRKNEFIPYINAGDIASRISRKGLSPSGQLTDEHLLETEAIQPFVDSKYLHTIQIVNGTKPQELVKAMNGVRAGSYILK